MSISILKKKEQGTNKLESHHIYPVQRALVLKGYAYTRQKFLEKGLHPDYVERLIKVNFKRGDFAKLKKNELKTQSSWESR